MRAIEVSAVLMRDRDGRVLHVRKRRTRMFMLPGGKPEGNESAAQTAAREFAEELGVKLDVRALTYVGRFQAPAANEHGVDVIAHVFEHPFVDGVAAQAEIETLEWIHPLTSRVDIAPLNTRAVFPAILP